MISVIKANIEHLDRIMEIVAQGKAHMARKGFCQWTKEYPGREQFLGDILNGRSYVLELDGSIEGVAALSFEKESCYDDIEGRWLSEGSYAVIHRLCVSDEVRGTQAALQLVLSMELRCKLKNVFSIRADTHRDNLGMQGLMKRAGYSYCGNVNYATIPTGDGHRLAYEKLLNEGCCCAQE